MSTLGGQAGASDVPHGTSTAALFDLQSVYDHLLTRVLEVDVHTFAAELVARVCRLLQAELCYLTLRHPHSDEFTLAASSAGDALGGTSQPRFGESEQASLAEAATTRFLSADWRAAFDAHVARTGSLVVVPQASQLPASFAVSFSTVALGPRMLASQPLMFRERALGTLTVVSAPGQAFAAEQLASLSHLVAPAILSLEHERLHAAVRARLREQEILLECNQAMVGVLDIHELLRKLAWFMARVPGEGWCGVLLRRGDALMLVTQVRYQPGDSGEFSPRVLATPHDRDSVLDESAAGFLESPLHLQTSELLRSLVHEARLQPLDLDAATDDPLLELARLQSLGQCVACPLVFQGRTLGLALVSASAPARLEEDGEGRLLWALASQAACALSNALLLDDEKRRTFERSLLLEAARTAASSLDLDSGLQGFAALAARCLEANRVALYLLDGRAQGANLAASWGYNAEDPEASRPRASLVLTQEEWVHQSMESGLPCLLHPDETVRLGPGEEAFVADHKDAAVMIWPLQDARGRLGVVLLGLSAESAAHALRFDLMDALVRQMAVFVQNVRLFEEARLRADRLAAISEVTEAVNSSLDAHSIIGIAVRSLRFIVQSDVTALAVFSRKRNHLEIPVMRFADDDRVLPKQIYPLEGSLPAQVAETHEAVVCDDLSQSSRSPLEAHLLAHGVRSLIVLPLRLEGKVRAALLVGYRRPGVVTAEQVEVLGEVSIHLATALRNAEMFDEIRRINDDLRRKDAVKSDFFSHVAHDLRTPLTIVKGYVYVLLRSGDTYQLPADVMETLETIDSEADHLKELIENLISLAHLEATHDLLVPLKVRDVNLSDVVTEVLTNFRGMAAKHRVRLEAEVPSDLMWPVDRSMLVRVFYNLLGNALKFTRDGSVTVRLSQEPQGVLCAVADEGPGISPEHVERIFERFYHVDEVGENKVHGTGLGLSIVHSIVRAHGGRVWVESTLGKGTTFWFTLPPPRSLATPDAKAD